MTDTKQQAPATRPAPMTIWAVFGEHNGITTMRRFETTGPFEGATEYARVAARRPVSSHASLSVFTDQTRAVQVAREVFDILYFDADAMRYDPDKEWDAADFLQMIADVFERNRWTVRK